MSDCFGSLVHSGLDCGNFVLVVLPDYVSLQLHLHATDALATLHWLRLPHGVIQTSLAVACQNRSTSNLR